MHIKNYEFKAKVDSFIEFEQKFLSLNPTYIGIDQQVDTYFNASFGRLKLREGIIENSLIQYQREDNKELKEANIILYTCENSKNLKEILSTQLGVKVVVTKKRKIYFIENVKFHFDEVENLGFFMEIEAIDSKNEFTVEQLKEQCQKYFEFFELKSENLVDKSYSDLLKR